MNHKNRKKTTRNAKTINKIVYFSPIEKRIGFQMEAYWPALTLVPLVPSSWQLVRTSPTRWNQRVWFEKIRKSWPCVGKFHGEFVGITGLKAPGNYSASICYNFFDLLLGEPETLISLILGFSDVSMGPKINMICLWRHQNI